MRSWHRHVQVPLCHLVYIETIYPTLLVLCRTYISDARQVPNETDGVSHVSCLLKHNYCVHSRPVQAQN